jgi:hypothetical protein
MKKILIGLFALVMGAQLWATSKIDKEYALVSDILIQDTKDYSYEKFAKALEKTYYLRYNIDYRPDKKSTLLAVSAKADRVNAAKLLVETYHADPHQTARTMTGHVLPLVQLALAYGCTKVYGYLYITYTEAENDAREESDKALWLEDKVRKACSKVLCEAIAARTAHQQAVCGDPKKYTWKDFLGVIIPASRVFAGAHPPY